MAQDHQPPLMRQSLEECGSGLGVGLHLIGGQHVAAGNDRARVCLLGHAGPKVHRLILSFRPRHAGVGVGRVSMPVQVQACPDWRQF
jgi:hypothetical protein